MSVRGLMAMICEIPSVKLGMSQLSGVTSFVMSLAPWGLPAALAAGWMVYPALTPSFKQSIGLESPPPTGQDFKFDKEGVGENPELSAGSVK